MYEKELKALKRANRYRKREIIDENFIDIASNDYLRLAHNKELFQKACKKVSKYDSHGPKASQLINGYHPIHKEFEEYISNLMGFEESIVLGSGYLANIALFETLGRRGDILILDELFHASGVMASKLSKAKVTFFRHNDMYELRKILSKEKYKRAIVAVEGIYSMDGDLVKREVFDICDEFEALLVIDEAHSMGVVGKNLLGVFDLYGITPQQNHIKMATLGKAIGSYGAYIQASTHIIEYLQNRSKSIIYTTAPSLFDIALALEGYKYIVKNKDILYHEINQKKKLIKEIFDISLDSLILKLVIGDNQKVLKLKEWAKEQGFMIGAIRPPTVQKAILRIVLREDIGKIKEFLKELKIKNKFNNLL